MEFSPVFWIVFFILIGINIVVDLGLFSKKGQTFNFKKSILLTISWILMAIFFGLFLIYTTSFKYGMKFFTGYLVEFALSLDNVFVFLLIFRHFGIPINYQHRVLFWGVLGAIIMRLIMISLGVFLIRKFEWIFIIFGVILIYSAYKMWVTKAEEHVNLEDSKLLSILQKYLPITKKLHKDHFMVKNKGKHYFTPLAIVLILVEQADLVFAIDSIPAVMAISKNTFIIFTSNIFAILGLRSMYFVLASIIDKFIYLNKALTIILGYVGAKMLALPFGFHLPVYISFIVILCSLTVAIIASVVRKRYAINK